jgi:hypothetical protein
MSHRARHRRRAYLIVILQCVFFASCLDKCDPDPTPGPSPSDGPDTFVVSYAHSLGTVTANIEIGVWMHKGEQLARNTIARWLGVPYEDRELFEPINVLWVDPTAATEATATSNIVKFLDACNFKQEGDQLFGSIPSFHSVGYSAWAGGKWRKQYDPDDAWVQWIGLLQASGDHGRIFPAFQVTTAGQSVFFTTGAFSRETNLGRPWFPFIDCIHNKENCHGYLSFREARDRLNCGAPGWTTVGLKDFQNSVPTTANSSFSTGDHDGVIVFERAR